MSTDIPGIESETPGAPAEENPGGKDDTKETRAPRSGVGLAFLAFLLAAAALAGSGWNWWQGRASQGLEQARVLTEIARLENSDKDLSSKLNQVRDQLGALAGNDSTGSELAALQRGQQENRSTLDRLESALNEQMSLTRSLQATADSLHARLLAAEAGISGMSARELDAGGELDVAEVDYLLRLANERLKLFSDPVAAGQALEVADLHLAALDNPMYLGVRQEIAAARRQLEAVTFPDYLQISGRLAALQQEIINLPFQAGDSTPAGSEPEEPVGWWAKLKGVFSNLVTVRRSTAEENQRISLQDRDYIRQGAWLQLEVAQLALMRRDEEVFRAALGEVKETISTWFDPDDSQFRTALQEVDELAALDVRVDVPDITAPWSTLRLLRAGSQAPAPVKSQQPQVPEVTEVPAEAQEEEMEE